MCEFLQPRMLLDVVPIRQLGIALPCRSAMQHQGTHTPALPIGFSHGTCSNGAPGGNPQPNSFSMQKGLVLNFTPKQISKRLKLLPNLFYRPQHIHFMFNSKWSRPTKSLVHSSNLGTRLWAYRPLKSFSLLSWASGHHAPQPAKI